MSPTAKIFAIVVLVLFSGFFSSSETAFFSLNKIKLRRKKIRKAAGFKYIVGLLNVPGRFLTTVLIGNEIVNISISVVSAALVYSLAKDIFSTEVLPFLTMAVTVPVLLLFGEIIPKTIAVKFPETVARLNSYPLYLFSVVITPVRFLMNKVVRIFVKIFVKDPSQHPVDSVNIDEDMFKSIVDMGSREGTIEKDERDLIHRAFRMDDIMISRIMTPRDRIAAIPLESSSETFMEIIEEEKNSRYPVYEKDIDHIVGFVHAKDLLRLRGLSRKKKSLSIRSILRKPAFILESRNALSVLLEFQKKKSHIGIVVNIQHQTTGIVTLEDILEELFGEIKDETDMEEEHNG